MGALILLAAAACSASSVQPSAPQPAPAYPLSEEDVQRIVDVIEFADRKAFDPITFSDAASAEDPRVRRQAAYAAGRTGQPDARPTARHLLADADGMVASAAAFALGMLADTASVSTLSNRMLVRDSTFSVVVATAAATALGRIGTPDATETLRGFLLGIDSASAASAPGLVAAALLASYRAGVDDADIYTRWMDAPAPGIRRAALQGLIRHPASSITPLLRARLVDADGEVRALAVRGLRRQLPDGAGATTEDVVSDLLPLLHDSVYGVRIEAVRTLATFDAGPARDAVRQIARQGGSHERAAALEALGQRGEDASDAAGLLAQEALAPDAHLHHRALAAVALAAVAPSQPSTKTTLGALLEDDAWRLRAAAGEALATLPALDYAAILPAATDPDPRVATATIRAIAEREDTASLRSVRSLLIDALQQSDPQLRAAAIDAGARIADPSLFSLFLDAYAQAQADSVPDAQIAAIDAISALREHGIPFPERAFFARFPESSHYLVRQQVEQMFGRDVRSAWGPAFPLASGTRRQTIESAVREWIAPADRELARPWLLIETDRGDLTVELLPEEAPLTVANFLALVRIGFFDGQEWPRVVPNFVIQGGDIRGDTSGSLGYVIRDELNRERFEAGTLGMALAGPDSGGSQFFLAHSSQPHLDGTYTAFARLLSGRPVMEELLAGDRIVRIVEIPRQMAQ